ncbi:MAG TPA: aldo/keto reductase, partial [Bryobacteraceae bacterium]|nr:aldo/keto reductase [Bryobacteraceae bacterium]
PLCREEQIGFLGYSPLGAGFLAGKYSPDRSALPPGTRFHVIPGHVDVYFREPNFRVVEQLHQTAAQWGVPPLRMALRWVLDHPDVTTVLCGARTRSHLENALAALTWHPPAPWPPELAVEPALSGPRPGSSVHSSS